LRIANNNGRAVIVDEHHYVDISTASNGKFGPGPDAVFEDWHNFIEWAQDPAAISAADKLPRSAARFDSPVTRPSQIFAIGLNYADHANESKMEIPQHPVVFTKFGSCLAGPDVEVRLTGETVDWETELVVVMGASGRNISEDRAWDHVAGLTIGQDLSDRTIQFWSTPPQFSLGKSAAGFAPLGPAIVTVDELRDAGYDPNDLALGCTLVESDGRRRELQDGRTRDLIFPVPRLIAELSKIVELRAGDLIFTGTPSGVGAGRDPKEFLKAGQILETVIEGLGMIRQTFVAP
jgi:2,4-diketo-3-deoxy-L-fuconate hydrolase